MTEPKRIQLRRTKGWRKPEGAVVVSRPSKWGNPYKMWSGDCIVHEDGRWWWITDGNTRRSVVDSYWDDLHNDRLPYSIDDVRRELRGKDLACWCPLDEPCHADELLRAANADD